MSYTNAQLGSYTLAINPQSFQYIYERGNIEAEVIGGRSTIQDEGIRGERIRFRARLVGADAKTNFSQITNEINREDILYFNSDMTGECYVAPEIFQIAEVLGSVYGDYRYTYDVQLLKIGSISDYKRATIFNYDAVDTDFTLTRTLDIPLPYGAINCSETVDFNRVSNAGNIPVVENPSLASMTYSVSETNLSLGNISLTRSGREFIAHNGLIKIQSRHDESTNTGDLEISAYQDAAWSTYGRFRFATCATGGTLEETNALAPGWKELQYDKEYLLLQLVYPSTPTNGYKIGAYIWLLRGKPFFKCQVYNYGSTLSEVSYRFLVNVTSFRYYTKLGATCDAQASAYGTTNESGASASVPYHYLHTASPLDSTTSIAGFIRAKLANTNLCSHDAGNYWDCLYNAFLSLTLARGSEAYPVWFYASRYDADASRGIDDAASEAMYDLYMFQSLVKAT